MQAIMESGFDILYLSAVITMGICMIRSAGSSRQVQLFGIMTVVLGAGDAFHLVPRVYAMWTTGLEAHTAALGFGKLVTSVTMTAFYVILYHVWRLRYQVKGGAALTAVVYLLATVRVALCLMPGNRFMSPDAPLEWGIYRNIPFALLGLLLILLYEKKAKETRDQGFRLMWLAITLSFGFYIPVVLWADAYPPVGMLMIPKTCAYLWMVWMGYHEQKKENHDG